MEEFTTVRCRVSARFRKGRRFLLQKLLTEQIEGLAIIDVIPKREFYKFNPNAIDHGSSLGVNR